MARHSRDKALLDAVGALPTAPFAGTIWRVVRDGRDPTQCSAVGGRWDDRSFDVLYTSVAAEGAVAEMYFHLSRGQPVMPSLVKYRLHALHVVLAHCVTIAALETLAGLGLDTGSFGKLAYAERQQEYPRTQEIAEAAYFHGGDAILVPSARSPHQNLVVFCGSAGAAAITTITDHGIIDWCDWRKPLKNLETPNPPPARRKQPTRASPSSNVERRLPRP